MAAASAKWPLVKRICGRRAPQIAILKPNENIKGKYLYYYLQTGIAQQRIELEINTGSQRNIGIDSLKSNIVISIPKIEEQIQIAAILTNLDKLITLHQRMCNFCLLEHCAYCKTNFMLV